MTVVLPGFSAFAVVLAASPALADTGVHWTYAFSGRLFLLEMYVDATYTPVGRLLHVLVGFLML